MVKLGVAVKPAQLHVMTWSLTLSSTAVPPAGRGGVKEREAPSLGVQSTLRGVLVSRAVTQTGSLSM